MLNQGVWTKLEMKSVSSDNLGQKFVDNIWKLSKIDFFMECNTANFLRSFTRKAKIGFWVVGVGTCHKTQAFQGFSCNFLIS